MKMKNKKGETFSVGQLVCWEIDSENKRKSGIITEFMKWDNGLNYAIIDGCKMFIGYLEVKKND